MATRFSPAIMLVLLAGTAAGQGTKHCFKCSSRQPTFREEMEAATIVIHGVMLKPGRANNTDDWITPIKIKAVFKKHPLIDKAEHINVKRELNTQDKDLLIFADIFKDEIDPDRKSTR